MRKLQHVERGSRGGTWMQGCLQLPFPREELTCPRAHSPDDNKPVGVHGPPPPLSLGASLGALSCPALQSYSEKLFL